MNLAEFVKKTFKEQESTYDRNPRPRIVCNNGLSLSVQGNEVAYCEPRINVDSYSSMEIGFPSRRIEKLKRFAEEPY